MAALTREAVASVINVKDLRFIGFSHFECDECGDLFTLGGADLPSVTSSDILDPRWEPLWNLPRFKALEEAYGDSSDLASQNDLSLFAPLLSSNTAAWCNTGP